MEVHIPTAGTHGERRHELRHAVERPCRIYPAGMQGIELNGITGNVSRSGMYLTIPSGEQCGWLPIEGETVLVLVELPSGGGRQPRFLECTGRIVRTESKKAARVSFAVEVHTMRFQTRAEAARKGRAPLPVQ